MTTYIKTLKRFFVRIILPAKVRIFSQNPHLPEAKTSQNPEKTSPPFENSPSPGELAWKTVSVPDDNS
jgi:hypothetical protein